MIHADNFLPENYEFRYELGDFCLHRFCARQSDFPDFLFSFFFSFFSFWYCAVFGSIPDSSNPLGIIHLLFRINIYKGRYMCDFQFAIGSRMFLRNQFAFFVLIRSYRGSVNGMVRDCLRLINYSLAIPYKRRRCRFLPFEIINWTYDIWSDCILESIGMVMLGSFINFPRRECDINVNVVLPFRHASPFYHK